LFNIGLLLLFCKVFVLGEDQLFKANTHQILNIYADSFLFETNKHTTVKNSCFFFEFHRMGSTLSSQHDCYCEEVHVVQMFAILRDRTILYNGSEKNLKGIQILIRKT
jgi:hypothetical protein